MVRVRAGIWARWQAKVKLSATTRKSYVRVFVLTICLILTHGSRHTNTKIYKQKHRHINRQTDTPYIFPDTITMCWIRSMIEFMNKQKHCVIIASEDVFKRNQSSVLPIKLILLIFHIWWRSLTDFWCTEVFFVNLQNVTIVCFPWACHYQPSMLDSLADKSDTPSMIRKTLCCLKTNQARDG